MTAVSSSSSLMFVGGFIVYKGALWTFGDGADENLNFPVEWISFDTPFFPRSILISELL